MNKNGDVAEPKAKISNDLDEKPEISDKMQFDPKSRFESKWY